MSLPRTAGVKSKVITVAVAYPCRRETGLRSHSALILLGVGMGNEFHGRIWSGQQDLIWEMASDSFLDLRFADDILLFTKSEEEVF